MITIGFQAPGVRSRVVSPDAPPGNMVIRVAVWGKTETDSATAVFGLVFGII